MKYMRTIGPRALEAYVGDRVWVYILGGNTTFYQQVGELAESSGGDDHDFYLKDPVVLMNWERVPQKDNVFIKHGDVIKLQTQNGGVRDYVFIDESD